MKPYSYYSPIIVSVRLINYPQNWHTNYIKDVSVIFTSLNEFFPKTRHRFVNLVDSSEYNVRKFLADCKSMRYLLRPRRLDQNKN